jgi:hypothetical protein
MERSKEPVRRWDLAGWAEYGYCASHSRYFWGCGCTCCARCTTCPWASCWPGGKADERQVLLFILGDAELAAMLPGHAPIGDQNYYGRDFEPPWLRPG